MPELPRTVGPSPSARLFVALWPDARTRRALAAWRDACHWPPGARPVPDAKLHLTLHFIGAVPQARVAELVQRLTIPCPTFELRFDRVAAWPRGLVVIEAADVPDVLRTLHAELAAALRTLGLPVERRALRPHVTLARDAAAARWPAARAALTWPVAGAVLVQSLPEGPYRVLSPRARQPTAVCLAAGEGPSTSRVRGLSRRKRP